MTIKYLHRTLITLGIVGILNIASAELLDLDGAPVYEYGFIVTIVGLYTGAFLASTLSIILDMGALWLLLGLAIKFNWFRIRERVSKKTAIIILCIFLTLLVLSPIMSYLGKSSRSDFFTNKDLFELNKECAEYRSSAMQQTSYNFPNANYKVQEIFYSPVLSSCVYTINHSGNTDTITRYYDALTGTHLYHSFSTLYPYRDEDGNEVPSFDLTLNNVREDYLQAALKTNSKRDFREQIQNYSNVEGSEEYQLDEILSSAIKWYE